MNLLLARKHFYVLPNFAALDRLWSLLITLFCATIANFFFQVERWKYVFFRFFAHRKLKFVWIEILKSVFSVHLPTVTPGFDWVFLIR